MSRPPPDFPHAWPTSNNPARSSGYPAAVPPPGSVHPSQMPHPGAYPPPQPAPYPPSHQQLQPPPIRRTTHPHYDASGHASHAPPPAMMHSHSHSHSHSSSHSSSPPHPSARLPPPQSFPVPSVQRGYPSAYPSGSPPSSSMMMHHDRAMTMPIPGQVPNAQSMPYQMASSSGVARQQSHSGMPGGQLSVTGGWSRHDERHNSDDEEFGQDSEVTSNGSDYVQERSPPYPPFSSGPPARRPPPSRPPCKQCGRRVPRERVDGFCSEQCRWNWNDRHRRY